ncbi:MAG: sugar MFS transporter [Bacteroidetes bacterium]|jgi:MFS transporter, FHS family, L-fucose permease|nr:sugar MFS transporter [Bacteroidota bacterium]
MNAQTKESGGISLKAPFIIVTSLFFMWGFITVMVDGLIPRLKDVFELTLLQAGLVQFAWFAAYGLISIPGGNLIERIGYKRGILTGLGLASLGCLLFYPAAATRMYPLFLLALFVVAGGITILQVAANPYISVLGAPEKASSRLNLAQAFNSLGTTIAPIVAASFLLSDKILNSDQQNQLDETALDAYRLAEASAVQGPFVALAVAFGVLAVLMGVSKLPRILGGTAQGGYRAVLQNKRLVYGAIGIFVYVGAEVAIGSYMVNYGIELGVDQIIRESTVLSSMAALAASIGGKSLAGMDTKGLIGALLTFYWGGAMIGRFIGSIVMNRLSPQRILGFFALCAAAMTILSVSTTGVTALLALLSVGFFNSIMFPTIFTLGISQLGDLKPLGSGVLCTAIVGGAIIPPSVGGLADQFGFSLALILPVLCYFYIQYYAMRVARD